MLTMIQLVRYIKKVQLARLEQIAQHFQQKPALVEGMLSVLVQQKKVVYHNNPLTCGKKVALAAHLHVQKRCIVGIRGD